MPARARDVIARIEDTANPTQAIAVIQRLLLAMPFAPDPVVDRAITLIRPGGDEETQVSSLARVLGLSERHLERTYSCTGRRHRHSSE